MPSRHLIEFAPDGITRLAHIAFDVNERTENIGARRLSTVMERLLDEVSFDAPNRSGQTIAVDAAMVDARLGELAKNEDLSRYIREAVQVSNDSPVLLDRFLDHAVEVDVDIIADMDGNVLIGGIMEHIEEAGIHSGDSSCALPPITLGAQEIKRIREAKIGRAHV